MPYRKNYRKKAKKGYKGFGRGAPKSAYRPRFISRELQLLNRRPQSLTQKVVHSESMYIRQLPPAGGNSGVFSLLQCRASFPGDPMYFGDATGTQTNHFQSLTKTETTLFNQMGEMYEHAYVIGAKIEVHVKFLGQRPVGPDQAQNPSQQEMLVALGVVPGTVNTGHVPQNDIRFTDHPTDFTERQNFRVSRVMVGGNSLSSDSTNQPTNLRTKDLVLKAYYSPKKILGVKDVADVEKLKFPIDNALQAVHEMELPQFVLAIGHNCDNTSTSLPIVRGAHNDCYITFKTTYIVKCVEPTDARGSNLLITTNSGTQTFRREDL